MMVWHSLFAQGKDSAIAAFRSPLGCQLSDRILIERKCRLIMDNMKTVQHDPDKG
jgi:hypothetical protein